VIPGRLSGRALTKLCSTAILDRDGHPAPRAGLLGGKILRSGARVFISSENAQIALAVAQRAGVDQRHPPAVRAWRASDLPEGRWQRAGGKSEPGRARTTPNNRQIPSLHAGRVQTADWLLRASGAVRVVVGTMLS